MASEALLRIKVIADTSMAAAGLDKASGKFGKFGDVMKRMAVPAAAVVGAIGLGAKAALDAASDYQQAAGAVKAVFGSQAKAVTQLSKDSATRLGLAGDEYLNYAALVGGALQNAGFSTEQAVGKQDKLLGRAADLAATYGGTTADAVDAINAAISRSEFDPLEKFNVSLNMTAVNAILAKRGQDKLTGAAMAHAKAQVIMEQIYKKSGKAAGQFTKESDSAAHQQQVAAAQARDAAKALGDALLPAYTKMLKGLAAFAKWAGKNRTAVLILVGVLGVLAVAILAVNVALAILALNPVSLVIIAIVVAIAALVVGFVILWNRSKAFQAFMKGMWNGIRTAVVAVAHAVSAAWRAVWPVISAGARAVAAVIRAVGNGIQAGWNAVGRSIKSALGAAFRFVTGVVRAYASVVRSVFNVVRSVAASVASFVKSVWAKAWSAVVSAARAVGKGINSALSGAKSVVTSVVAFIKSKFSALWRDVSAGARAVGSALSRPFEAVRTAVQNVISAVQNLIGWLGRIKVPKISLPHIGGKAAKVATPGLAARHAIAPSVSGPRAGVTTAAAGGVVINIHGAVDPEGTARQIQRLLANHDRRVGHRGLVVTP